MKKYVKPSTTELRNALAERARADARTVFLAAMLLGTALRPAAAQNTLTLEINPDLDGNQTTWAIVPQGGGAPLCSGGPYAPGSTATIVETCVLADGCYELEVYDSAGDGMVNMPCEPGGYRLHMAGNPLNGRIVDDRRNFEDVASGSTFLSRISGGQGGPNFFCVPLGSVSPIASGQDRETWQSNQYLVSQASAAVSAQWGAGDQTDDGYDFWFFNPNGGYSFIRSRRHSTSDGFGPASATRACHMKINNWSVANQLQTGVLYNVRIRPVVNGAAGAWGPAYRFRIDGSTASCQGTSLVKYITNTGGTSGLNQLSCGVSKVNNSSNYIYAQPVSGATQYQWRFRACNDLGFVQTYTTSTYFLKLGKPVLNTYGQYVVDVRVFRNGNWCVDAAETHWGPNCPTDPSCTALCNFPMEDLCVCTLTIIPAFTSSNLKMADVDALDAPMLYPNPSNDGRLWIMTGNPDDEAEGRAAMVEVRDMFGKMVFSTRLATGNQGGPIQLTLPADMGVGMYLVTVMRGASSRTERVVLMR